MKVFTNKKTVNNDELPIRKGSVVPDGAVNLAWHKAPDLNPKNNLIVIDSTRTEGPEKSGKFIAYANMLGILEDELGNQAWPEEFPLIGDEFLNPNSIQDATSFLPYVHISRYFHLDYAGMAFMGAITPLGPQPEIKIVDKNDKEYLDDNGNPRYKVSIVRVNIDLPDFSRNSAYRLWVFFDSNPAEDELFLIYHKVEIENGTNEARNEQIGYKESVNAREYFKYLPEETEVVDHSSFRKHVYSTNPIDLKDQIVGRSQPTYKGWQIQVPKKAIPDPRKFELFRWRLACEYSKTIDPDEQDRSKSPTIINAGVVTYNTTLSAESRANYIFAQLNESSFNTGGIKFVNPISESSNVRVGGQPLTPDHAQYWQVPIKDISDEDLAKFDILIWAPTSKTVDLGPLQQKIERFVESNGRTLILETSSRTTFSNLPGIDFSPKLSSLLATGTGEAAALKVAASGVAYYDYQDATPNSSTLGSWNTWPPVLEDMFTNNSHSSQLLKNLNFLGGWDLDSAQELKPSAYLNMSNVSSLYFQYITETDSSRRLFAGDWDIVADAPLYNNSLVRHPVLVRRKYNSGGSIVVSTGCFFEDHIVSDSNGLLSSSYQIKSLDDLPNDAKIEFSLAADSSNMEGEIKLRVNLAMLSTAFRPSSNLSTTSDTGYNTDSERHSVTVYSDWESSWVINAHNDVLDTEEKVKYNFALLPKSPENSDPVWMRMLSNKTAKEIMDAQLDKSRAGGIGKRDLTGYSRRYTMLITNPAVETYTYNLINDETIPAAWTYSFSPKFIVPHDLGAHVIREEFVAGVGVGNNKLDPPARPYKVRSTASWVSNLSESHSINVNIHVTGTARKVYTIPPYDITEVIPPPPYTEGWYVNKFLRWGTDSNTTLSSAPTQNAPQFGGLYTAWGVQSLNDSNYTKGWVHCWPYWGFRGTFTQNTNPNGHLVWVIQEILNHLIWYRIIPGPGLAVDGYYGSATASRVLALQQTYGALYQDGKVDAETWSLLGRALLKLWINPGYNFRNEAQGPILDWASWAEYHIQLHNMGDVPNNKSFYKQSWSTNGPGEINDSFCFNFDPNHSSADISGNFEVFELWVKPATNFNIVPASGSDFEITWLDVGNNINLQGYNASYASHGPISVWAPAGQHVVIPFSPRAANSVMFGVKQVRPAGSGSSRAFGVEDVAVLARTYEYNTAPRPTATIKTTTIPGRTVMEEVNFEYDQQVTLTSGIPQNVEAVIKNGVIVNGNNIVSISGSHNAELNMYPSHISEFRLTSYVITPTNKIPVITVTTTGGSIAGFSTGGGYQLVYNNTLQTVSEPSFIAGPKIGDGSVSYYVKSLGKAVEPFSRSYGWVNKKQGVLLITDSLGKPYGFPQASPTRGGVESTFTRLTMDSWETDQTLTYGFYDTLRNEWVENANGEPDISYYDYVRRGVQNVYMAVQTTYEIDQQSNLPPATDPVMRPFKTAMPIYGVKTRNEGSVKLRNPSVELGHNDVWPIMISTGGFSKQIYISSDFANSATSFLKRYGNKTLSAHYLLREGVRGPWSDLLGRPYKDTVDERPRLLSDDTIIVNSFPIASIQEPTLYSTPADPVKPLFKVYRRETFNGAWTEVPLQDIKDYNLYRGIITLKNPLTDQDNRLVKVSYTSRDYTHYFKYDNNYKINLNPYIMRALANSPDHITALEKPLYVYIKPSFIVDNETKEIIAETHEDSIIGLTTSNTIFNPLQADYDPLAYRLGVIFVTTTMNIEELNILDSRVRGGGAQHHIQLKELSPEAKSYWDTPAEQPYAYQQGGFLVIQLPKEILEDFPNEAELRKVIDRNITAGVAYELQDYFGEKLTDFSGSF